MIHFIGIRLLLLVMLPSITIAVKCSSRFYCKTTEVKYLAMEEKPGALLNVTAVKTYHAKDLTECQTFCIRENSCQSINLNMSKPGSYECQLLNVNMYSNASFLVTSKNFLHLHIPSKCESQPCLYGGRCIPIYRNDSYTCECKSNSTFISKGKHCEIVHCGYASAFLHWSFNKGPWSVSNINAKSYSAGNIGFVTEPGRKLPVMECKLSMGSCSQIWSSAPCVNNFDSCLKFVTYSLWVKFSKQETKRSRNTYIMDTNRPGSQRELRFLGFANKHQGYHFQVSLTTSKRWIVTNFGKNVTRQHWNHFTFTVNDDVGVCAYVNGVKEKCESASKSVSLYSNSNVAMRIGGTWAANTVPEMFVDDFALWKAALTEEEVHMLYQLSKQDAISKND